MPIDEQEFGAVKQRVKTFEDQYERLFTWTKGIETTASDAKENINIVLNKMTTLEANIDNRLKSIEDKVKNGNDWLKSPRMWLVAAALFGGGNLSGGVVNESLSEKQIVLPDKTVEMIKNHIEELKKK